MSLLVDIRKRFKGFTLSATFNSDGTPLGILGESGSGKSMTLRCIAGIERPDEGRIVLNGRVLFDSEQKTDLNPQQRRVGYLFQNYALFPHMTVAQNIACGLPSSLQKEERTAQINALLGRYELTGLGQRFPGQLSGGQQQRVALARILAGQPEALLLDEPFSALDTHLKERLQVDMKELLARWPGDAVMVTHSRDEVYKLCENLLVLEQGRVAACGPTKGMFTAPGSLQVARLTGCKNFSRAKATGLETVDALDWGLTLRVAGPLPADLAWVGVRAHDFHPAPEANTPNRFPVEVYERMEGPFEWNVLLRHPGALNADIWWKVPKELWTGALPDHLAVAPQHILLLRDEKEQEKEP